MGGLAGHLNHLYENPSLTFNEIKEVFSKASSGNLEGTEKTDGQNLFLSYSVKEKRAKAARNKGNIKQGGMSARELADKFADRGTLTQAFVEAFDAWEEMVSKIPMEQQIEIFGPDANIFYNAEIQDPRNPNVINYDQKNLVIHQVGHAELDKSTGNVKDVDVSDSWATLNSFLMQGFRHSNEYRVTSNAVIRLKKLDNDEALNDAVHRINVEIGKYGLSDNDSIADYVIARLNEELDKVNLPDELQKEIIKRIVGVEGVTLNTINNLIAKEDEDTRQIVKNIVSDKSILKNAIYPIEDIVHDFSVEILSYIESAFLLDQKKETERLRKEVSIAIDKIKNSGHKEAIALLNQQLRKLKSVDKVNTAIEGFVFSFNGQVYKFTGNFAPINQILGLFKYGRGNIQPFSEINEQDSGRKIALIPGGFKPPHKGHLASALYFLEKAGVDEVIVMISPKSRFSTDESIEISAEMSQKIWEIFARRTPGIKPIIAPTPSPVKAAYDFMETLNPGDELYFGSSEKDSADTRFIRAQEWSDKNNLGVVVKHILTPTIKYADEKLDISATKLRDAVASGDQDLFFSAMPDNLSLSELQEIWNIVSKKSDFLEMQDLLSIVDETIEEMSAMSSGAVSGFAQRNNKKPEEDKLVSEEDVEEGSSPNFVAGGSMSAKRDDDEMIDRKQYLQEMKLRSYIQKALRISEAKRLRKAKKELFQERKLRSLIRDLIAEATEDMPHESTGINVLEELLKKIIPILETDYKTLTTDPSQRKSFRSHILVACQNALAPSQIFDEPPAVREPNDGMMAEQDLDVDIDNTPEDEKFIDIDGDNIPDNQEKQDNFTIPGEDETGRNVAMQSFEKIEKTIIDSYATLSNEKDRSLFYDYLITNLKLYFDKFEDELRVVVPEPESDIYQKEKDRLDNVANTPDTPDTPDTSMGNTDLDLEV
jgi:hypothetical protein